MIIKELSPTEDAPQNNVNFGSIKGTREEMVKLKQIIEKALSTGTNAFGNLKTEAQAPWGAAMRETLRTTPELIKELTEQSLTIRRMAQDRLGQKDT